MRVLLLIFVLFSLSWSDPIILHDHFSKVTTSSDQITVEDKNNTYKTEDILYDRYGTVFPKPFVSYTRSTFWTKVSIKNSSDKKQSVIFVNPRAGTDKIDVHVYRGAIHKESYLLGDLRAQSLRSIKSIKSVFNLDLEPDETVEIISKFGSLGAMNLSWEIMSVQEYYYSNSMEIILYALFAGIVIALIIYNTTLYLNLKEPALLLYVLHGFCLLWFQYAYNGMFYFLNFGINLLFLTISSWFIPILMSILMILFMIVFFKLKQRNKFFYTLLAFFGWIDFLIFLIFLYQLVDPSLLIYSNYFIAVVWISILVIVIVSMYALYKRYPGAIYFVMGEAIYLSANVYVSIIIGGQIDLTNNYIYAFIPAASLFEMILLSIALSSQIGEIKRDNDLKNTMIQEGSKFISVGKSIGNVTHQWKEPLSQLSSHLMYLESLYVLKKHELLVSEFGDNIEKMNEVLTYMKDSVNELYDFYSNSDYNGDFNLKKQINMAYKLQRDNLILSHIDVEIDCPEDISVRGAKHAFSNILMILFDNSIYQLTHAATPHPLITLRVQSSNDTLILIFSDNGGGIDPKSIPKIFSTPHTTKGKSGSGLGLPLTKKLIEERLHGTINVHNNENGAIFTMILQIKGNNQP